MQISAPVAKAFTQKKPGIRRAFGSREGTTVIYGTISSTFTELFTNFPST
jgi:hypothetical protein